MPGTPLTGPDGKKYAFSNGALQPPIFFGVQLEKEDKKRQKILEILEYVATDQEGYLTTTFGKESVTYNLEGDLAVAIENPADKRSLKKPRKSTKSAANKAIISTNS